MMSQTQSRDPNRLYFGSVSFEKTEDEIREFFSSCGEVKDIYCIKCKDTYRFQGYGFITFKDVEGKKNALNLNGSDFGGRAIKVNSEDRGKDATKSGKRLFIKNIPTNTSDEDVKQAFSEFGIVESFFTVKDKMTRLSKGFGFLDFTTPEEAQAALGMDGRTVFGQQLSVKIAHEKKPDDGFGRGGFGRGRGRGGFGGGYGRGGGFGGGYGRGGRGGRGGGFNQSFSPYGGRGGRGGGFGGRGRGYGGTGYGAAQNAGGFGGAAGYGAQAPGGYGTGYGAPQPAGPGYGAPQQGAYGGATGGYGGNQW